MTNKLVQVFAGFFLCVFLSVQADAASIHFYKLNRNQQQVEYLFLKNADRPGCHNFKRKKKIVRAGQVGFAGCKVYAEENCQPGSEYSFNWAGKKVKKNSKIKFPTNEITPGNMWVIGSGQENFIGRSWRCTSQ